MKITRAYKIVSRLADGRLASYNSVVGGGVLEPRAEYFTVIYEPGVWAYPILKGTKLFALSRKLNFAEHGLVEFAEQYVCEVEGAEPVSLICNAPGIHDIRRLWENRATWNQEPYWPNNILCSRIRLLRKVKS